MIIKKFMQQKVISYQIADSIDIKQFCDAFKGELFYSDPSELLYKIDSDKYVYVFKYGAACFLNFDIVRITEFLQLLKPFCKGVFEDSFTDEFLVVPNAKEVRVGFDKIEIPSADIRVLRFVMLNVSQSVALDYYEEQTNNLLEQTNSYTQMLEMRGRLDISGKKLRQYIGRTLLLRNRIA